MHSHISKLQIFECYDLVMLVLLSDSHTEYDTLYSLKILSTLSAGLNTHDALSQSIELIRHKLALALL